MTDDQINNVLRALTEGLTLTNGKLQVTDPAYVTVFQGDLKSEDEAEDGKTVTVEIADHGPDFHPARYRYFSTVRISDGRDAVGNGGATPEKALEGMHWRSLPTKQPAG